MKHSHQQSAESGISKKVREIDINNYNVHHSVCWSVISSWLIPESEARITWASWTTIRKRNQEVLWTKVQTQLHQQWNRYLYIYTNWSKELENGRVAFDVNIPEIRVQKGFEMVAAVWALWSLFWKSKNIYNKSAVVNWRVEVQVPTRFTLRNISNFAQS